MIEDPVEDSEVQSVLMSALSLQEVHVSGDGSHSQVIAVGESSNGMSRVKKQQTVYDPLMEYITDNHIYTASIKAYAPAEQAHDRKLNDFWTTGDSPVVDMNCQLRVNQVDKLRVRGLTKLQGEITISGAKNAALPIFFAALLTEKPVETQNIPELKDVDTSTKLLSQLGTKIERNGSTHINACDVNASCAPYDPVKTMRASTQALGPLVARSGQGQVSLPGGYTVGTRPASLHIFGLEQLDAATKLEGDYVKTSIDGCLKGVHIVMGKVSVGAMAIIMYVATSAEDTMIIENTAREPEVIDTMNFLITLGARIGGQGTDRIVIEGVERLGGGVYRMLPNRIETGTFLVVAAISRGKIICYSAQPDTLDAVLAKLRDAGANIEVGEDWISLDIHGRRPRAVNVRIAPHPAFPTDMQAQLTLSNLIVEGTGLITETVFENCFMHMSELSRMGAHAEIEGNTIICHGVERPSGAQVMAADLRASVSLMLAGCITGGTTVVDYTYHIDHGYERVGNKLCTLGANIKRVEDE